jgi:hypothetical protein
MSDGIRSDLNRKALQLEYATIGWNVGEAFLTIGLGIAAGSLALGRTRSSRSSRRWLWSGTSCRAIHTTTQSGRLSHYDW